MTASSKAWKAPSIGMRLPVFWVKANMGMMKNYSILYLPKLAKFRGVMISRKLELKTYMYWLRISYLMVFRSKLRRSCNIFVYFPLAFILVLYPINIYFLSFVFAKVNVCFVKCLAPSESTTKLFCRYIKLLHLFKCMEMKL